MKVRLFLLAALSLASLRAGEAKPWQVRTELIIVDVPTEAGLRLVPALRDRRTTAKTVAEIEGMIASGQATLHARPVVWSRHGQRVMSESAAGLSYPAHFTGNTSVYPGIDAPDVFEIRETGLILELEAFVEPDGQSIKLNIVPQHITVDRWNRILDEGVHKEAYLYESPLFHVTRVTTSLRVESSAWTLLGVYSVAAPAAQVELFLLRATAKSPAP